MMSKAEFEKAYTAHRNRLIGEATICPDAVSRHSYLYHNVVDNNNNP